MIYAENILICIAVPLLIACVFIRGNVRRFAFSFLLGMAVCLLSAYISGFIMMLARVGEEGRIYLSPIVEEIMKFLPLLICLFLFAPDEESLFLMGIGVGTGFATFENCCYILTYGADNLTYVLIRGMAVGVMHIVSIMMLTLGIILVRRFKALSFPGIFGSLSLSITFHGLYNLLVSEKGITSYIGYMLPLVTISLLYLPFKMVRETVPVYGGKDR